jgi:hypothetical protein
MLYVAFKTGCCRRCALGDIVPYVIYSIFMQYQRRQHAYGGHADYKYDTYLSDHAYKVILFIWHRISGSALQAYYYKYIIIYEVCSIKKKVSARNIPETAKTKPDTKKPSRAHAA